MSENSPEIRFVGELQRCDVKPGDRFVLMTDRPMTSAAYGMLQDMWRDFIGSDEHKLLVLDPGWRIGVIGPEAAESLADRAARGETVL